jgi:hypothetical protein
MKTEVEATEVGSVYAHIGNSGVTFSVVDEGHGPQINIRSSTFGNNEIVQKVMADLAALFAKAAEHEFSEEYCNAGYNPDNRERGSGEQCCGGSCQ